LSIAMCLNTDVGALGYFDDDAPTAAVVSKLTAEVPSTRPKLSLAPVEYEEIIAHVSKQANNVRVKLKHLSVMHNYVCMDC